MDLHQPSPQSPSSSTSCPPTSAASLAHWFPLILFAALLSRGISQPWTGLHDWNGAFYSQLARNLLRYPFDMHHGMPVVAVGPSTPDAGEWSFYPTHPPGLVWCIAAAFQLFGEHEWAARLVSVMASIGTLCLLVCAIKSRHGGVAACVTGVIYALLPMAAYFGRMPDQEAPCLFLMLAAVLAADRQINPSFTGNSRISPGFAWSTCISAAIWMDWVAVILAGLVSLRAIVEMLRGRITPGHFSRIVAPPIIAAALLISYLVYFGFAGRISDLIDVFSSRAGVTLDAAAPDTGRFPAWTHTVDNLTLPVIVLSVIGMVSCVRCRVQRSNFNSNTPAFVSGLSLLAATGALWVGIFWRQYLVHHYWLAYMGPAFAMFAARGLLRIHAWMAAPFPRAAAPVIATISMIALGSCLIGINGLFERIHVPVAEIQAWKEARKDITRSLGPDKSRKRVPAPVLLFRNPIRLEQRGHYCLRNIVPPHFAYYFDYPFEVEPSIEIAAQKLPHRAGLLLPTRDAVAHSAEISALLGPVDHISLDTWQLFKPK